MFQPLAVLAIDQNWAPAILASVAACLPLVSLIATYAYCRLRNQKLWLDTAIYNMSQGLTMFDKSSRLVLCNQRYIEMYGLSPDVVKPGLTVHQLVDHRIETGSLTATEAANYVKLRQAAITRKEIVSNVIEMMNGRTILVTRRSMPGGGWVTTHEDITERRRAEARIAHMAHHDALTDLPNRVMLRDQLEAELVRVRRGGCLAVLYLDLDHFKSTNDTLGHLIGDELLKVVADRLRACVREADTIARLGGDEFAIIQTGIEHPSDATTLAGRIREAITMPYDLEGHQLLADISIGISMAPNDGTNADELLKQADLAMYGAKSDGRGTIRFFEPEMDASVKARRTLELDLRNALANDEFELHYQPLINLERNEICGCEALLRWNHPKRGLISPDEFIPVAEETGLIVALGKWVLRTACTEAATWPDDITVAVNVSPVQFKEQTLVLMVIGALAESGLPAHRLEIEITEAVLMCDNETILEILHQLGDMGVRIAMDDFGIGYSSLSYLRSFPFDKIKIDRSFIRDLSDMNDAAAIVQAVTSLAGKMNMTTTAEGVETQAQLDKVRALGCTEMQGYLFSRPLRAPDIARLFLSHADKAASAA